MSKKYLIIMWIVTTVIVVIFVKMLIRKVDRLNDRDEYIEKQDYEVINIKNSIDIGYISDVVTRSIEREKPMQVEVYAGTNINIREEASIRSCVVRTMSYGEKVVGTIKEGSNWIETDEGFVHKDYVVDKIDYEDLEAPDTRGFKSFLGYNVFGSSTKQGKLQECATTTEEGLRVVDGRYCVAMGSYYSTSIGQYFDLVLENGVVIPCILGDGKADCHTDSTNRVTIHNGCISEFIVDERNLNSTAMFRGDVSFCKEGWNSPVDYVRVYDKNFFE